MLEQINIIFPPGTGGNHLANLISLDEKYLLPVDFNTYDAVGAHVHQSSLRQNDKVQINLFHIGHLVNQWKLGKVSKQSKTILITLPPMDKSILAYQRLSLWAKEYTNQFVYDEHFQVYSKLLVDKLLDINCTDINASLMFDENVSAVLLMLSKVSIDINQDKADIYHRKWLTKMKKYIEFETNTNQMTSEV